MTWYKRRQVRARRIYLREVRTKTLETISIFATGVATMVGIFGLLPILAAAMH